MKKRNLWIVFVLLCFSMKGFAQIRDVSFTVSPLMEHTWWNKNLTMQNSTLWGGRVGFGFGPIFEIRGFYAKSLDVEASLRSLDWSVTNDWADKMTNNHIDLSRYGGELKFNLLYNTIFAPYITLGGGVQTLNYQLPSTADSNVMSDIKEEQLFGALGLGTKISLSDRIVLSLEAKNTFFNVDGQSYYLKPDYQLKEKNNRLYNWSVLASLDFYLGGVNYENRNAIERAYADMFSDGFRNFKFVVEPGGAYVDFNDKSNFGDQYFLGGSAGFDFSPLVGIRGFYYQATQDPNKISLDFNNQLAMYGGNIIARLNLPRGVNPYIILGAGYLETGNDYLDKNGVKAPNSTLFGLGGLGLEIPMSKYVALFGSANAMITPLKEEVAQLKNPAQIQTNMMYQAGLRFNVGRSVDANKVYNSELDRRETYYNQNINDLKSKYASQTEELESMKREYELRIQALNEKLDAANQNNDVTTASSILKEKRAAEEILQNLNDKNSSSRLIRMSSADFENLVSRILREIRGTNNNNLQGYSSQDLSPLEQQLLQRLNNTNTVVPAAPATTIDNTDAINRRLDRLEQKLDRNYNVPTTIVQPSANVPMFSPTPSSTIVENSKNEKKVAVNTDRGVSYFKLNRVAMFTGFSFGNATLFNVGVRGYMQISDTNMDFVPELYVGMGKKDGLGVSGSVIYNFSGQRGKFINPYVGLGLGLYPGDGTHFGPNVIVGSSLNALNGNLFVDYTIRSLFKQNQLAVGYRFVF